MTSASEHSCRTTILVENIHCASCVSTIREILTAWGREIQNVDVNALSQEIHIIHDRSLDIYLICAALGADAFEVHSATSMDKDGIVIRELEFASDDNNWLERLGDAGGLVVDRTESSTSCLPFPLWKTAHNSHIQNCEACRRELKEQESHKAGSARNEKDLEAGDVGLVSRQSRTVLSNDRAESDAAAQDADPAVPHDRPRVSDEISKAGKFEATLSIGGMTCSACTSSVKDCVSELSFVESVNVNLMTNSATLRFSDVSNLSKIVEAVEDRGYECTVDNYAPLRNVETRATTQETRKRTVQLKVKGMFCQHCPTQIIAAVKSKFPDVVETVRFDTASTADPTMTISYYPNPPDFTIRDLVAVINATNEAFEATIYKPPSIEQRSQAMQRKEQRRLMIRLIFTFLVAIPTFLIGVVWMDLVSSNNSIRQYLGKPRIKGSATGFEWALFILATPVMFLAADVFHLRALKEIRALWRPGSRVPILRRFYRFGSMNLLISAGTTVAYLSSVTELGLDATSKTRKQDMNNTYFDSVVFLTFFILLGRWLEAYSRAKTGNAVAMLKDLRPATALLVRIPNSRMPSTDSSFSSINARKSDTGGTILIDTDHLEIDDIVLVQHGASPPTDGSVFEGSTDFNESSLTGESRLVKKDAGDKVFAGAINAGGAIKIKVSELNGTSMLDQIVAVVREGQTKRAPVERVVDVVTGYFVPVITALAIVTFIVWVALGSSGRLDPKYVSSERGGWTFWSLEFAIAVFVVACPCGIGLAAPTALFVGSGLAAEYGILVRGGGEAFQEASNIDCIVFDKTGTLTEGGDLRVTDHEMLENPISTESIWSIIERLEETSSHPLAKALLSLALTKTRDERLESEPAAEQPGLGIHGVFKTSNKTIEAALGSEKLVQSLSPSISFDYFSSTTLSRWKSEARSVALLAVRELPKDAEQNGNLGQWSIVFIAAFADPIRASTIPTLEALRANDIPTYMLTGDNPTTASAVASTLSIPQDHVFAGVLPTEKADKIRWLQDHFHDQNPYQPHSSSNSEGDISPMASSDRGLLKSGPSKTPKKAIVAFVGDGINDAPALTAANVSISFSSATDIAVNAASFVLLSSSSSYSNTSAKIATTPTTPTANNPQTDEDPLSSIPILLSLSRRVFRRVKFNFAWAVVYNIILVPVAAGCLFRVKEGGWRLGPVWGSAAMAASSLCVVGSSLALRGEEKIGRWWRGMKVRS